MRAIGHKINPKVSPEMLQSAKNLRMLATLIEGGTATAIAFAWTEAEDSGNVGKSDFCADGGAMVLLASVTILKDKLLGALINQQSESNLDD